MRNDVQETRNVRIQQAVWDIIYLAACALHKECPDKRRTVQMDLEEVYRLCRFHSMEAIVHMALEQTAALDGAGQPLAEAWKEAKEKAVRKNLLMDMGRKQILGELEQMGIWYMPLKGSILQSLYPGYGMRQMSDNDILYDASRRKDVVAVMEQCGYRLKLDGNKYDNVLVKHDAFMKPPVYNFEMHTALFEQKGNSGWYRYYQNVKDRLLKDPDTQYGYHFTDEDFYIYMTAHASHHYSQGGCGLRILMDSYVYIWKKGADMDWDYVEAQTSELGIAEFEKQTRQLSMKLFQAPRPCEPAALTEKELEMLSCFAESGTYGTAENYVENYVAKKLQDYQIEKQDLTAADRLRYLWNRLFPGLEWFRENEPFYARHKILIPFFLIYRIIRHLLFFRKWLKKELSILWKIGRSDEDF